jgi:hypothetical protein
MKTTNHFERTFIIIAFLFMNLITNAQPLSNIRPFSLEWQKTIGGNNLERNDYMGRTIASASGLGYLSVANTNSNNLSGFHGDVDVLATRIDNAGNIVWQKCFGGSGDDEVHSVINTSDGGFMIMSWSTSIDGDIISLNHGNYDLWLLKINNSGNIQWSKCYGGSEMEFNATGLQNADGSYMISSNTSSNNGDVSGNHGDFDIWLIKINATGNLLWQKCYGGSGFDGIDGGGIIKTIGGGYVINGDSNFGDGDLAGAGFHQPVDPSMGDDEWLIKIDNIGNIQWSKCFGGEGSDWFRYLTQFSNGDFIGTGTSIGSGHTGDMPGSYGEYDWWVARISSTGNLIWSRHYGGSNSEAIHDKAFELSNGEIILPGGTISNDIDVSGNTASKAVWIMKTDPDGNIIGSNLFGTVGYHQNGGTILNDDGSLTINAMKDTTNLTPEVENENENSDVWTLKIKPVAISNHDTQLYNSATGKTVDICSKANSVKLNLRITIPPGFISLQGVTIKWYKNNHLISTQNASGGGFAGVYGKTIYRSLNVTHNFILGDGIYKAKISYDYKQNPYGYFHQKNNWSNDVEIDFNNNCGLKLAGNNFEGEKTEELLVYPNPATGSVTIKFPSKDSAEISIANFFGQIVYTKNLQGINETQIDVSNLPSGMYVVRLSCGENNETKLLSVTK